LTFASTRAKQKPSLDENSFQQLLAAAYVVQQHNETLRRKSPQPHIEPKFAEVAEIQALIQAGGLDLNAAAPLVADRLLKLTGASAVNVSVVSAGYLDCIAESGVHVALPGGSLASHSLVATERLKNGKTFESSDAQADIRLDVSLCAGLGIGSFIAAPIQAFGEIKGLVEARWERANGFTKTDIQACRLMAEVVSGVLERGTDPEGADVEESPQIESVTSPSQPSVEEPKGTASEPTTLSPELAVAEQVSAAVGSAIRPAMPPDAGAEPAETLAEQCRVCGRPFQSDEVFCGHCSMPRVAASTSGDGMQSKWASLWYMQQAQETLQPEEVRPVVKTAGPPRQVISRITETRDPALKASPATSSLLETRAVGPFSQSPETEFEPFEDLNSPSSAQWSVEDSDPLRRASKAVLRVRRSGGILILGAIVLVLAVLLATAWPGPPGSQLTWFESLLVRAGLAELPARSPAYPGRSDVQVWVDVHTALYYCPGSNLYGKTPGGRLTTQRDAQQDNFEPASRLACQ
jgi:hypothetical protein